MSQLSKQYRSFDKDSKLSAKSKRKSKSKPKVLEEIKQIKNYQIVKDKKIGSKDDRHPLFLKELKSPSNCSKSKLGIFSKESQKVLPKSERKDSMDLK